MYEIKLIKNNDGSVTATCGAWIILRAWSDGSMRLIAEDTPSEMRHSAMKAVCEHFKLSERVIRYN